MRAITVLRQRWAFVVSLASGISVLLAATQSVIERPKIATAMLLAVGTAGLLTTIVWIHRARATCAVGESRPIPRFNRRIRLLVTWGCTAILMITWTVVLLTYSPVLSARLMGALGFADASVHQYEKALEQGQPLSLEDHLGLAAAYEKRKDIPNQVRILLRVVSTPQLAQGFEELPRQDKAQILFSIGSGLIVDGDKRFFSASNKKVDMVEAVRYLTMVLSIDPDGPNALVSHWILGFALAQGGADREEVLRHFRDAQEIERKLPPSNAVATQSHYWKARALLALHDRKAAEVELKEALRLSDGSFRDQVLLRLAENAISGGGGAVERVSEYLKQISDSRLAAEAMLSLGTAYFSDAQAAYGTKDFERLSKNALQVLGEAADLGADGSKVQMLLGVVVFMRGDTKRALTHFQEWHRLAPSGLSAYWIARSLVETDRAGEAEPFAKDAVKAEPQNPSYLVLLGRTLAANKKFDEAIQVLELAVPLSDTDLSAQNLLYVTLQLKADSLPPHSKESISTLERALDVANRAIAADLKLRSSGKSGTKRTSFIEGNKAVTLNSLAYAYAESHSALPVATKYANEAVSIAPDNWYYLDTLGWIRTLECAETRRKSACIEARRALNKALGIMAAKATDQDARAKAELLYHIGILNRSEGYTAKANEMFLKALSQDPKYDLARDALSGDKR